ncbi:MAG: 2,3-bisphosphoglycerate-independent phosphoglycerate mutase [Patescibacteria group bacterium]|nr:2,3-bisphosphoglycerate-independent phosphoglycerate mutase [Patescibacteria group bacterium]MDD5121356.1 2,3-bisphosphoglycerate-independent phosphoglycerate mutase [Patescibacteria group bacterium]MDD5222068.1 2,3-bisphosphoglycerate-independent phosphoglycerate mutase [Patescibacteria group bacterium]MDD5395725.1 2,3-bisphosphoglycerate-independent phosphoglycerate mutase [Patescibacteria group bacterium]
MPKKTSPTLLIILDGWGVAPPSRGNAITLAKTPTFLDLKNKYPYTELCASGKCVGLPVKQDGNSEAGHLNLGAGRIVKADAVYISESIKDGTFSKNPIFLEGINYAKKNHSKIHLMGLITEEQSAHSSPEHWLAMLNFLDQRKVNEVYLHLFTDGRDSPQHAAINIIRRFENKLRNTHEYNSHYGVNKSGRGQVKIASICGRFYAMDRNKDWDRISKVYNLLVLGEGLKVRSAEEAIVQAYNRSETDEFILPSIICKNNQPVATIGDKDVVVFMNLRSDRARELAKAFTQKDFNKQNPGSFHRRRWSEEIFFIALSDFGPDLDLVRTAYPSRLITDSLPLVLKNYRQLYLAESEKFAHMTFFFNGGYDHPVNGEQRLMVPSAQVKSYDLKPEMSAAEITKNILKNISEFDFMAINFANPDMLGHTGNLEATIKGLEFTDHCLAKIVDKLKELNGSLVLTADHGNAEEMINLATDEIDTQHSTNPVPCILVSSEYKKAELRPGGNLADVAPTILDLMGVERPSDMKGKSLITK